MKKPGKTETPQNDPAMLTPIIRLTKDAVKIMFGGGGKQPPTGGVDAAEEMPPSGGIAAMANASEARQLVDLYYTLQELRKRVGNQLHAQQRGADPSTSHLAADFMARQAETLEHNAALFLDVFSAQHPISVWLRRVDGIGPVIAAGLIAHLGARPVPPTVGHWWRYAGLDPSQQWLGAEKLKVLWENRSEDTETRLRIIATQIGRDPETVLRDATTDFRTGESKKLSKAGALKSLARIPFNRPLKTLCWKVGDQFVKLGENRENAFYAKYYRQRKAAEIVRNERGDRAELARQTIRAKPNHAQKAIYEQGRLPDGRVDLMARRATVKLFLSHLHQVWHIVEHGALPPKPFAMTMDHAHYIPPPYSDAVPAPSVRP